MNERGRVRVVGFAGKKKKWKWKREEKLHRVDGQARVDIVNSTGIGRAERRTGIKKRAARDLVTRSDECVHMQNGGEKIWR